MDKKAKADAKRSRRTKRKDGDDVVVPPVGRLFRMKTVEPATDQPAAAPQPEKEDLKKPSGWVY